MTENRLLGADFVRASACLLVFAHHLLQRLSPGAVTPEFGGLFTFGLMGAFGVSAFFVLSGFLLSRPFWLALDAGEAMPSLKIYALRRFARIAPGFWLALTTTFVVSVLVFRMPLDRELVVRYLAGMAFVSDWHWMTLFPVQYNGPLWSIGFEVTAYALLPLFLAALFALRGVLPNRYVARVGWLAMILVALGLHALALAYWPVREVGGSGNWIYGLAKEWMPRFNPFGFFAIFAIGALAGGVQVLWRAQRAWVFDGLAAAGLALCIYSMFDNAPEVIGYGLLQIPYDFPAFPAGVALMLAALPQSRLLGVISNVRPVPWIAKISFGIYIWHFLVLELIGFYWVPEFQFESMGNPIKWAATSAVAVVITLAVATQSYRWIEAPAISWARRLERRRPVAAVA